MSPARGLASRAPAIEALFTGDVVAFDSRMKIPPDALLDAERECLSRASPKRARDFATGRICARSGMAVLGVPVAPLLSDSDRVPIWPSGIVGSISHTDEYCVAVVALAAHRAAVGVDAETVGRLGRPLWPRVLCAAERTWVDTLPEALQSRMATVIFSAKEAFYKCQYALTRSWLGFEDARVEVIDDSFAVSVVNPRAAIHRVAPSFAGRFLFAEDIVVTGISMKA